MKTTYDAKERQLDTAFKEKEEKLASLVEAFENRRSEHRETVKSDERLEARRHELEEKEADVRLQQAAVDATKASQQQHMQQMQDALAERDSMLQDLQAEIERLRAQPTSGVSTLPMWLPFIVKQTLSHIGKQQEPFTINPCLLSGTAVKLFEKGCASLGMGTPQQAFENGMVELAFHGTPDLAGAAKILCEGFDPSKRSGQNYGPGGEYFDTDLSTAPGYTRGASTHHQGDSRRPSLSPCAKKLSCFERG